MIIKTTGYQFESQFFPTLDEALAANIESRLNLTEGSANIGEDILHMLAIDIVKNKDKFIDILTTGPKSRPKARKINKSKKPLTPKIVRHEAEQFELPKVIEHSETGA